MSTAELDSAAEFERRAELLGVPQLFRDALRVHACSRVEHFWKICIFGGIYSWTAR